MPELSKTSIIAAAGLGGFSLLLLIISVGTVTWLDDGNGNTVGLFRQCVGNGSIGCYNANQTTQGGLSVFGLLLLVFGIIAAVAYLFLQNSVVLLVSLVLFYFSSMFVMAAYATWGVYSRDPSLYLFPNVYPAAVPHTSMGASYNLCVATHYFLWTSLTILAFGVGHVFGAGRNDNPQ